MQQVLVVHVALVPLEDRFCLLVEGDGLVEFDDRLGDDHHNAHTKDEQTDLSVFDRGFLGSGTTASECYKHIECNKTEQDTFAYSKSPKNSSTVLFGILKLVDELIELCGASFLSYALFRSEDVKLETHKVQNISEYHRFVQVVFNF